MSIGRYDIVTFQEDANLEYQKFTKEVSARLKTFNWKKFNDKVFKRLAKTYYIKGSDVDEDLLKLVSSHFKLP